MTPPHASQMHNTGHFAPIIQPPVLPQTIYGCHSVSDQPAHALGSHPVYQSMQQQYPVGAESPYNHRAYSMQPTQSLGYSPPGHLPVSYARSIGEPEPETHISSVYSELERAGKLNYLSHAH